jgi:hypothetical protein
MTERNVNIDICPFCGGHAQVYGDRAYGGHGVFYDKIYVRCDICKAKGPSFLEKIDGYGSVLAAKAIHAWNNRVIRGRRLKSNMVESSDTDDGLSERDKLEIIKPFSRGDKTASNSCEAMCMED